MSPARRAKLSGIGMWACAAGAVLFLALAVASSYRWLKCWGTVSGWRLSAGVERGSSYVFLSKDWPDRPGVPHPAWLATTETLPPYPYEWWGWFWPWRPLTSGSAWFRQFAFPCWLPVPILGVMGAFLRRVNARAKRDLVAGCPACGYDRRGIAMDAACPECGANA